MTRIELIMAFFGVTEREAILIAAIDDGKIGGDAIELTEEELAEFLSNDAGSARDESNPIRIIKGPIP